MRTDKKKERATQKLIELLKSQGKLTEDKAIEISNEPLVADDSYLEAEAVLLSLEKPARFTTKVCKECGEAFGTDYRAVAYCSDHCRAKALKRIGILWNYHKHPRERWGSPFARVEPPLVIPPDVLKQMAGLLESQRTTEYQAPQEPELLPPVQEETPTNLPVPPALSDDLQFPLISDSFVL